MFWFYTRPCHSNIPKPIVVGAVSEMAVAKAEFSSLIANSSAAIALLMPLLVTLPLVVVGERMDEEDDGPGHGFVYTNWSGPSLQDVVTPATYVPFG